MTVPHVFSVLVPTAVVVLVYVSILFTASIKLKRNDIADIGWGMGIFIAGLTSYVQQATPTLLSKMILFAITLWALRLSLRIYVRNSKKEEDARYKKWRESWGRWFYVRSFFQIYLLQGTLMLVLAYPLAHVVAYGGKDYWNVFLLAGFFIWMFGFLFEAVSDYQLDKFLSNRESAGKLMKEGLWGYSRHPNYFGEVVLWWGVWCMMLTTPHAFFAIVSPLTITLLILKVSGVPVLEKSMASHPDFEAYARTTSKFIPLPKKKA